MRGPPAMNRQASSGPRGGSEPGAAPAARSARRRALLLLALVGTHALAFFTGYSAHGANALRGVAAAAAAASSAAAGAGLEVVAARLGAGAAPAPGGAAQQQALGQDGQQATQHVKLTGAAAQSSVTAARAALRARLAARAAARGAAGSQQQISLRPAEVAAFSAAHPAVVEPAAAAAVAAAAPTPGRVADLGSGGDDGAWVGRFRPYASGGIVVYTWTNLSMKDFLMMFLLNLRRHGLTSFVIGAMDPELRTWLDQARRRAQCARACAALTARGRGVASLQEAPKLGMVIPVLTLNAGLTTGDFGWNSPSFKRMAKYKFQAVQQMMALGGWDVVVADTDTAWLRNPLPYFASKPEPDILTSTDVLRRMHIKDQLHSTLNIGVMVFRARPGCVDFVTAFYTEMVQDPGFGTANAEWDQSRFNRMVRDGMEIGPREREWALGWQGRVKVQALDIVDFPNGHVFFTQRLPQTLGVVPCVAREEGRADSLALLCVTSSPELPPHPPCTLVAFLFFPGTSCTPRSSTAARRASATGSASSWRGAPTRPRTSPRPAACSPTTSPPTRPRWPPPTARWRRTSS